MRDSVFPVRGGRAVIARIKWDTAGFGNAVVLDHLDGEYTLYAHLDTVLVHEGSWVERHAPIGTTGYSGNADSLRIFGLPPHLHFGLYNGGSAGRFAMTPGRTLTQIRDDLERNQAFFALFGDLPASAMTGVLDPSLRLPRHCIDGPLAPVGGRRGAGRRATAGGKISAASDQARTLRTFGSAALRRVAAAGNADPVGPAGGDAPEQVETAARLRIDALLAELKIDRADGTASDLVAAYGDRIASMSGMRPEDLIPDTARLRGLLTLNQLSARSALTAVDSATSRLARAAGNPVHEVVDAITEQVLNDAVPRLIPVSAIERLRPLADTILGGGPRARMVMTRFIRALPPDAAAALEGVPANKRTSVARALAAGTISWSSGGVISPHLVVGLDEAKRQVDRLVGVAGIIDRVIRADTVLAKDVATTLAAWQDGVGRALATTQAVVAAARRVDSAGPSISQVTTALAVARGFVPGRAGETLDRGLAIYGAGERFRDAYAKADTAPKRLAARGEAYFDVGFAALGAATALGVNQKTIDRLGRGLAIGQTVFRAFAGGAAAGNPLAVLGAVGGLFGGGPDPAEVRHQELLERLGVIDEKLDRVLEGQRQIQAQIRGLSAQIDSLSAQVTRQHLAVMGRLDYIADLVASTQSVTLDGELAELDACGDIIRQLEPAPLGSLQITMRGRGLQVAACQRAFIRAFPGSRGVSLTIATAPFRLMSYQSGQVPTGVPTTARDSATVLAANTVLPLDRLARGLFAGPQLTFLSAVRAARNSSVPQLSDAQIWGAFRVPSGTVVELEAKAVALRRSGTLPWDSVSTDDISNVLWSRQVLKVGPLVRGMRGVRELYADDSYDRLLTSNELATLPPRPAVTSGITRDEELLSRMRVLVELAILQETMRGGDLLLPWIAENLTDTTVQRAISDNPVLLANLVRYLVYTAPGVSRTNPVPYAMALARSDSLDLISLLRDTTGLPSGDATERARHVARTAMLRLVSLSSVSSSTASAPVQDSASGRDTTAAGVGGRLMRQWAWELKLGSRTIQVPLPSVSDLSVGAFLITPVMESLVAEHGVLSAELLDETLARRGEFRDERTVTTLMNMRPERHRQTGEVRP